MRQAELSETEMQGESDGSQSSGRNNVHNYNSAEEEKGNIDLNSKHMNKH